MLFVTKLYQIWLLFSGSKFIDSFPLKVQESSMIKLHDIIQQLNDSVCIAQAIPSHVILSPKQDNSGRDIPN